MILVSSNCTGLGSGPKTLVVKYPVKSEKPSVLLIQETKMSSEEVIKHCKSFWWNSNHIVVDAREASNDICTLWDEHEVSMQHQCHTQHWIFTKLKHNRSNICYAIFNVYMSNNPTEKAECWNSLLNLRNLDLSNNSIIASDLNIIWNSAEKKGGILAKILLEIHWKSSFLTGIF